jgi:NADH-quinone oxidoreductase subunit A
LTAIPPTYLEYWPVLLLLLGALGLGVVIMILTALFKARRPNPVKLASFECGVPILGPAHVQVSVKFYLFALLFLLFDMETMFILAWAAIFRELAVDPVWRNFLLVEMGVFIGVLLVGYVYAWRKGAFNWS